MNGEQIWEKFEDMREVMGDTDLLIALADSLGLTSCMASCFTSTA